MILNSQEKTLFRQSKTWKDFRKQLLKDRGCACELCGTKYSGRRTKNLQVHHLVPADYTNLNPKYFRVVCSTCHRIIELFERKLNAKKQSINNKEKWLTLLDGFLPISTTYTNLLIEENNGHE